MAKLIPSIFSALEYNNSIAPIMEEVCEEALWKKFRSIGVSFSSFGYAKIFKNGNWLSLITHKSWGEYFLTQVNDSVSFQETILNEINNNTRYLLHTYRSEELKIPIYSAAYDYGLWQGFNIYNREPDFVEFCYFHGTRENANMSNFYINNIDIFEHFLLYFKEKMADWININDPKRFININSNLSFIENQNLINLRKEYFIETPLRNLEIKGKRGITNLSKREAETLYYLLHKGTVKEIANAMKLSSRTVETYIESIKKKTDFTSKSSLIDNFKHSTVNYVLPKIQ